MVPRNISDSFPVHFMTKLAAALYISLSCHERNNDVNSKVFRSRKKFVSKWKHTWKHIMAASYIEQTKIHLNSKIVYLPLFIINPTNSIFERLVSWPLQFTHTLHSLSADFPYSSRSLLNLTNAKARIYNFFLSSKALIHQSFLRIFFSSYFCEYLSIPVIR